MQIVEILEELDVSGGSAIAKRPGLSRAIAMIEAGEADTLVVAYFDRLVRSLAIQAEIVSRIEAACGGVVAVDVGRVTNGSAGQWLSGSVLGLVAEYQRRTSAERTEDSKRNAIARGVATWPRIPPGYRRDRAGVFEPHPGEATVVREAFALRAAGAPIKDVQTLLRSGGIERGFTGTQTMLASRAYLGELHFGDLHNPAAHVALIDGDTFRRCQDLVVPRGRKPKSERLLARLGVLRCATCGARLVVGMTRANGKDYPMYRCPPNGDCPQRVTISAEIAEREVVAEVQRLLEGVTGTAAVETGIAEAEAQADRAERELEAAVRAFSGLDDVDAARERLQALREERDVTRDRVDELRGTVLPAVTVSVADWEDLTIDERRDLIAAVLSSATVSPGRGTGRLRFQARL